MGGIHQEKIDFVKDAYREGASAREIAQKLGVSLRTVYASLQKQNIPRRSPRENFALLYDRKQPSFSVKETLEKNEEALRVQGVMLYWAEGSKWKGERVVDFVNSDPCMIRIFLAFLRRVCQIDEKKLRVYLYCFSHQNSSSLQRYWSKQTRIPLSQFTKPYIKDAVKMEKIQKMEKGLIHVRYYDKKLLMKIMEWIEESKKEFQ